MDKVLHDIMGYNNCRYVMLPIAGDSLSSNTKAEVAIEPFFLFALSTKWHGTNGYAAKQTP